MPSLILYSAPAKLTAQHHLVSTGNGSHVVFVRAESHPGNPLDALDAARPMDGETVLNAVPVADGIPSQEERDAIVDGLIAAHDFIEKAGGRS